MTGQFRERFDESLVYPLRSLAIQLLVVFSAAAWIFSGLGVVDESYIQMIAVAVGLLVGTAVIPSTKNGHDRLLLQDITLDALPRDLMAMVASSVLAGALASLFFVVAPGCRVGPGEIHNYGKLIFCLVGGYAAVGVALGVWLVALASSVGGSGGVVTAVRLDKHLRTYVSLGLSAVKYWALSFFFLVFAASLRELELFLWFPDLERWLGPPVWTASYVYWSVLSARLAGLLWREKRSIFERVYLERGRTDVKGRGNLGTNRAHR